MFATEYPSAVAVELVSELPIHRVERAAEYGGNHYPDMMNVLHVAMPPAGIIVTNTVYTAKKVLYVDPQGVDSEEDGRGASADKPFKTLQYAVDRSENRTVIVAAEGSYDQGGKFMAGGNNRVAVKGLHLRILGAGAERSFIVGESDLKDPAGDG
jgi:hypothetical protein